MRINRKNTDCSFLNNKRMNNDVYQLRRKVIAHVYSAKALLEAVGVALPRIEVRITDNHESARAAARMGQCILWVTAETAAENGQSLQRTVWHEICHAAFNTPHVDQCPLMHPYANTIPTNQKQLEKALIKYATM